MVTCPLCVSERFCAAAGRTSVGVPVRCTRDPGHADEHVACGEAANEHPIFRWANGPQGGRKQYRSRGTAAGKRVRGVAKG